ncbi:hypothetical protein CPC08DRAFT_134449 [Agrocybe pediades]|nr:hypothetical protein CPC08DRAFT_134449 [Agrocybe pediades]
MYIIFLPHRLLYLLATFLYPCIMPATSCMYTSNEKKRVYPYRNRPHAMYAADESVLGKCLSCSRTSCFRLFKDISFLFSSNSQSHRSCITQLFSVYSSRRPTAMLTAGPANFSLKVSQPR